LEHWGLINFHLEGAGGRGGGTEEVFRYSKGNKELEFQDDSLTTSQKELVLSSVKMLAKNY